MTTYLTKSCSFGVLCMSFVNAYQSVVCSSLPFRFDGGMWDLIVLIPEHAISIYFSLRKILLP